MRANNTTPNVYKYEVVKYNKTNTIYQINGAPEETKILTDFVKVEVFQGYSKAYNLGLYFRVKDQTTWSKSEQLTGMWKCSLPNYYYGDYKRDNQKTLLLFKISEENQSLTVFEYPFGYYPSKVVIEQIVNGL